MRVGGDIYRHGLFSGFQWQIYKEGAYGRKGQGQSRQLTVGGEAALAVSVLWK